MCRSRRAQLGVWVMFQTFRHTCASLLFEAARDVEQVAECLGTRSPQLHPEDLRASDDEGVGDAAFMDDILAAFPAGGPS